MSQPLPTDAQLTQDEPMDEALVKDGIRDSIEWLWSAAAAAGIDPNVVAFVAGLLSHKHDNTPGNGASIPTAGIAADAVNDPAMIASNAVGPTEIATETMAGPNFADLAATSAKMSGTMGRHVTGSQAYDIANPPGADDAIYEGDRLILSNPKGAVGVICNTAATGSGRVDYWVLSVGSSTIKFGLVDDGTLPASGTWDVDCWII